MAEVLRHHFLEGVLRRLPAEQDPPDFVLRGSMLTRLWAAPFPRPAKDLDWMATLPPLAAQERVRETARRFLPLLAADASDGVRFDVQRCRARGIWESSAFPGVRLTLFADVLGEPQVTTVDVGMNDPLVPAAERVDYRFSAGGTGPVWAVHPATLAAWKLHGLAEWTRNSWRPKDLLDLWLLATRCSLQAEPLARALEAAFESRGYRAASARLTLEIGPHPGTTPPDASEASYWTTSAAASRWERFRAEQASIPVPAELLAVRDEVAARLAPALALLP